MAQTATAIARAALTVAICMTGSCATTPSSTAAQREQNQLQSIERERLHALVAADGPTLERLHADDFQAISPFGHAFVRAEYLSSVTSGQLDYLRWEPGDMEVRLHGTVAALRYKALADVKSRGKVLPTMQTWNTTLYERRNGHWVAVWFQVTQISSLPK